MRKWESKAVNYLCVRANGKDSQGASMQPKRTPTPTIDMWKKQAGDCRCVHWKPASQIHAANSNHPWLEPRLRRDVAKKHGTEIPFPWYFAHVFCSWIISFNSCTFHGCTAGVHLCTCVSSYCSISHLQNLQSLHIRVVFVDAVLNSLTNVKAFISSGPSVDSISLFLSPEPHPTCILLGLFLPIPYN